jgi:hypothetical protein
MKIIIKKKNYFFIFLVCLLCLISIRVSFINSKIYSIDFQYSPTKLLSEGINHYQYILEGKHDRSNSDKIMEHQNGEYAHGLYVLFLPFAYLSWNKAITLWAYINIFLSIIIPILLGKKFNLTKIDIFICTSIYLLSTIFRINIGWGQQTTFIFLFFILPFLNKNNLFIILSGISYFKYNIGYGLFLYFLALKKINLILFSLIPGILGWIFYSIISGTNLVDSLFQPLLVAQYLNLSISFPIFFGYLSKLNFGYIFIYGLSILVNFFLIYKFSKFKDELLKLSMICLSILIFLPHSIQDYLLLIPLLLFSVKNFKLFISKINLFAVFYFFFFLRIISHFFSVNPWEYTRTEFWGYLNIFILFFLLIMNLLLYKNLLYKSKKNFILFK